MTKKELAKKTGIKVKENVQTAAEALITTRINAPQVPETSEVSEVSDNSTLAPENKPESKPESKKAGDRSNVSSRKMFDDTFTTKKKKSGKAYTFYVDNDVMEIIKNIADKNDASISNVVNTILKSYIKNSK